MRTKKVKPYGECISYRDFVAQDRDWPLASALNDRLIWQLQEDLDNPISRYIASSWMNALIWEYLISTTRIVYNKEPVP